MDYIDHQNSLGQMIKAQSFRFHTEEASGSKAMRITAMHSIIAKARERGCVILPVIDGALARLAIKIASLPRRLAVFRSRRVLPCSFWAAIRRPALSLAAHFTRLRNGAGFSFAQALRQRVRHACCRLNKAPPCLGCAGIRHPRQTGYPPLLRRIKHAQFFFGRFGF